MRRLWTPILKGCVCWCWLSRPVSGISRSPNGHYITQKQFAACRMQIRFCEWHQLDSESYSLNLLSLARSLLSIRHTMARNLHNSICVKRYIKHSMTNAMNEFCCVDLPQELIKYHFTWGGPSERDLTSRVKSE